MDSMGGINKKNLGVDCHGFLAFSSSLLSKIQVGQLTKGLVHLYI